MEFFEKQKVFAILYDAVTEKVRDTYGLTRAEFDVLMFLHNNPQYKTAAQVVKIRKLPKSQVSVSVSNLCKYNLLEAAKNNGNKKTVFLTLTEEGRIASEKGLDAQRAFGKMIFDGFSDADKKTMKDYYDKALSNAEKHLTEKEKC